MRARATLIATALVALAACEDLGLENRNYPHEQAAHRPPDALVQAVHPETRPGPATPDPHAMSARPISVGGQTFMAAGPPQRVEAAALRQIGGSPAGSFSVAAWDEPPYDRLYLSHPGGLYVTYLPLYDSGDPAARSAAGRQALEGGAPAAH